MTRGWSILRNKIHVPYIVVVLSVSGTKVPQIYFSQTHRHPHLLSGFFFLHFNTVNDSFCVPSHSTSSHCLPVFTVDKIYFTVNLSLNSLHSFCLHSYKPLSK